MLFLAGVAVTLLGLVALLLIGFAIEGQPGTYAVPLAPAPPPVRPGDDEVTQVFRGAGLKMVNGKWVPVS